jgi:lysophospholipase L1-like esterase
VQVGDSILYCSRAAIGQPSHQCVITSRRVNALLKGNPAFYNLGVGSYTLALARTNAASREFALAAQGSYAKRVLFIQVGINDIATNGDTPGYATNTFYPSLLAYIADARAAGFTHIIVCTGLPRGGWDAIQKGTELAAYNALVRNGAAANGYTVCDRATDPFLGGYTYMGDRTVWQDDVHPTAARYDGLAPGDAAAINAVL